MKTITVPAGTIAHRVLGPADSPHPPVVFVHGFLVDGRLWDGVAERLAAAGVRCYLPDLPLGSHRTPLSPAADRTPRGVARIILDYLADQDLTDVTLVGNDTGGALCQFLLDEDASRVGRLVLTNCDAFDNFPPFPFDVIFRLARHPAGTRVLLGPMRLRAVRHSPMAYGWLARDPDPALTRDWLEPCLTDGRIRADVAAFARGVDPAELLELTARLPRFTRPVRLVWGEADRFFKPSFAHRLAQTFPDASYVGVPGARTFVSLDAPDVVAREVQAASAVKA